MGEDAPQGTEPIDRETDAESGDYSYDLAHDGGTDTTRNEAAQPARRVGHGTGEAPPPDPEGDYSYDLAHEVPPAER
jgi:hypothetical protein